MEEQFSEEIKTTQTQLAALDEDWIIRHNTEYRLSKPTFKFIYRVVCHLNRKTEFVDHLIPCYEPNSEFEKKLFANRQDKLFVVAKLIAFIRICFPDLELPLFANKIIAGTDTFGALAVIQSLIRISRAEDRDWDEIVEKVNQIAEKKTEERRIKDEETMKEDEFAQKIDESFSEAKIEETKSKSHRDQELNILVEESEETLENPETFEDEFANAGVNQLQEDSLIDEEGALDLMETRNEEQESMAKNENEINDNNGDNSIRNIEGDEIDKGVAVSDDEIDITKEYKKPTKKKRKRRFKKKKINNKLKSKNGSQSVLGSSHSHIFNSWSTTSSIQEQNLHSQMFGTMSLHPPSLDSFTVGSSSDIISSNHNKNEGTAYHVFDLKSKGKNRKSSANSLNSGSFVLNSVTLPDLHRPPPSAPAKSGIRNKNKKRRGKKNVKSTFNDSLQKPPLPRAQSQQQQKRKKENIGSPISVDSRQFQQEQDSVNHDDGSTLGKTNSSMQSLYFNSAESIEGISRASSMATKELPAHMSTHILPRPNETGLYDAHWLAQFDKKFSDMNKEFTKMCNGAFDEIPDAPVDEDDLTMHSSFLSENSVLNTGRMMPKSSFFSMK
eukprot:TRINITY_DN13850_c0_g3_i1.p1 TRINITY_DN13850_c0_g3~~TRINITY_DN13850_c0_g3_i1.p1  ORF type:complete len:611 (-),score=185.92 TRINITY_DN13850_c0_g3_i1:63-1895(-)